MCEKIITIKNCRIEDSKNIKMINKNKALPDDRTLCTVVFCEKV